VNPGQHALKNGWGRLAANHRKEKQVISADHKYLVVGKVLRQNRSSDPRLNPSPVKATVAVTKVVLAQSHTKD
jgi:hypothetical protein